MSLRETPHCLEYTCPLRPCGAEKLCLDLSPKGKKWLVNGMNDVVIPIIQETCSKGGHRTLWQEILIALEEEELSYGQYVPNPTGVLKIIRKELSRIEANEMNDRVLPPRLGRYINAMAKNRWKMTVSSLLIHELEDCMLLKEGEYQILFLDREVPGIPLKVVL